MDINNIFETNFLNLIVVISFVVKFIGGTVKSYLDDRLIKIAKQFAHTDKKQNIVDKILNNAKFILKIASQYINIITNRCLQMIFEETNQQIDLLGLELVRLEFEYCTRINSKMQDVLKTLGYIMIRQALEDAEKYLERDYCFFNRKPSPNIFKGVRTFFSCLNQILRRFFHEKLYGNSFLSLKLQDIVLHISITDLIYLLSKRYPRFLGLYI